MQKARGFTLIELIVVIVIIGILAAIAIPRFINQTTNARVAALGGVAGALNSASSLAQANYRAEGNSSSSTVTTTSMDGQAVTVIAGSGFPAATLAGIGTAVRTLSGFTPDYTSNPAIFNFESGTITNCHVSYDQTTGTATVLKTGC